MTPVYCIDPENSGFVPTGAGVSSSMEHAAGIHRDLASRLGEALQLHDFPAVTGAGAPAAHNGHAISPSCAELRIDRRDTVAVGDSVIDAPMLAWAGRGIAMPHADRYALDAAREVLTDDSVEALAALLETLLPR